MSSSSRSVSRRRRWRPGLAHLAGGASRVRTNQIPLACLDSDQMTGWVEFELDPGLVHVHGPRRQPRKRNG